MSKITIDHAQEIKDLLTSPQDIVRALGWSEGAKRTPRGFMIRCPAHPDKDPSCSVRVADDGRVAAKCFSCGWGADVLSMIALAHNLDAKRDFREVLSIGADIAGHYALAEEIRGKEQNQNQPKKTPALRARPEPKLQCYKSNDYPKPEHLRKFWDSLSMTSRDGQASAALVKRSIDPSLAAAGGLSRVIGNGSKLPPWASFKRQTWGATGHRLILPVYDHEGEFRSVRSWRVIEGASPKRLPPANCRASGLCLANSAAVQMLKGNFSPMKLLFVEGEPDFLTWATRTEHPVIGIGSGFWTKEHAEKIPLPTLVYIRTHKDQAGEKYAQEIKETLPNNQRIFRA